jgi:glutamate--cysteine ligase
MSIPQSAGGPIEHSEQMAAYLASGCKPESKWRIGTEHEKFGFCQANHMPLPYSGSCSIQTILEAMRDRFGWSPVLEADKLIGLTRNGANISLEPGGQFELSGAPLETVHDTAIELDQHLAELSGITGEIGAGFLALGAAPVWSHHKMPVMPKGRYKLMTNYMDQVGTMGKSMMYRTSCVQVNLDFSSEADMIKKMRVAIALQPIATALFSNSPFFNGVPVNYKSWRSRIWRDLDADRTGMLPFIFDEGFGFEAWVEYALDVPMYFVYRNGQYIDALGQSFRDFLKGNLPALPGEKPSLSDWADHLTTIFPEARLKQFIEMRGADVGSRNHILALSAFWVGICYDQTALDAAWDLAKNWTEEFREALRISCGEQGLDGQVNKTKVSELAIELTNIASKGLIARGRANKVKGIEDESFFLEPLRETVKSQQSPADKLLDLYENDWSHDIARIYQTARID